MWNNAAAQEACSGGPHTITCLSSAPVLGIPSQGMTELAQCFGSSSRSEPQPYLARRTCGFDPIIPNQTIIIIIIIIIITTRRITRIIIIRITI
jgi:hypothetical protein